MLLRNWITPFNKYDNVFNSMITFSKWLHLKGGLIFYLLLQTAKVKILDQLQIIESIWHLYSQFFIFITTFFIMNLFISVVVDKFNDEIKKNDLTLGFTNEEKDQLGVQHLMLHKKLKLLTVAPRENKFRRFFYKIS